MSSPIRTLPLKRKVAMEAFRLHRAVQTQTHRLRYFFWECTLRCNLSCSHCGSDCTSGSDVPDMPIETFLKVLEQVATKVDPKETLIVVTGGEPLVRKDLAQCGAAFRDRGFPWGMVTNGWAMTEPLWISLVESGIRSLTVSLDGLEETHDQFRRRKGSWRRAVGALAMAAATEGLTFDAMTSVTPHSLPELPRIREMLVEMGVKNWRLDMIFPKGRAKQHPDLFLSDVQYAEMMAFLRETRSQGQISAACGCDGYLGALEGQVRDAPFFCRAGINIGSVLCDGSISACPSLRADYIQGNIHTDDFWDVWENRFQVMRDRSWARTGKCKSCEEWKYCHGNGLHLRDETTKELAFCHLERLESGMASCC
ncbi:MAG: TIGR04133 family radical SAM/SPASM protein [Fibrobacterota bacterium]|nr:TIGR04133 family radical SAM/SPASM protein [Fibrobacterota bacterium]QQS03758.1 MAG: TIGR04133 family radical SAM/SPASM protein [Fibrobacterota bacterium]